MGPAAAGKLATAFPHRTAGAGPGQHQLLLHQLSSGTSKVPHFHGRSSSTSLAKQESYQGLTDGLPATLSPQGAADTFASSNNKGLSPTANSVPAMNSPCLSERSLLPVTSPLGPAEPFAPTFLLGQAREHCRGLCLCTNPREAQAG